MNWISGWVPGGRALRRSEEGIVVEEWIRKGDWVWHRTTGEPELVKPGQVPVKIMDALREAA